MNTHKMHRLIWTFAGQTYTVVRNAVPRLSYAQNLYDGALKIKHEGLHVAYILNTVKF